MTTQRASLRSARDARALIGTPRREGCPFARNEALLRPKPRLSRRDKHVRSASVETRRERFTVR
jgi:hypothetical protein